MLSKTIKRFYKAVDTAAAEDGWAVTLDARPVKTPAGKTLALPSKALADAIAEEWRAQGETVTPAAMPLTLLATTALDRVGPERDDIHDQLMKYVDTDLVCYRADFPPELVRRQTEGGSRCWTGWPKRRGRVF